MRVSSMLVSTQTSFRTLSKSLSPRIFLLWQSGLHPLRGCLEHVWFRLVHIRRF